MAPPQEAQSAQDDHIDDPRPQANIQNLAYHRPLMYRFLRNLQLVELTWTNVEITSHSRHAPLTGLTPFGIFFDINIYEDHRGVCATTEKPKDGITCLAQ